MAVLIKSAIIAKILTIVCFGGSIAAQPQSMQATTLDQSWPGFLGQERDGVSSEVGILTDWSEDRLPVLWKIESGDGYGIGSAADDRYYHFDSIDQTARLRCLNALDGKEIWRFEYSTDYEDMYGYDAGPRSSPLIDGDRIFIYGVGGQLHCLSVADGEQVWSCDTTKLFGVVQNFFGVGSSPIVFGDLLLVMVGGSPAASQSIPPGALGRVKSDGSGVVAFDKRTGDVVYRAVDDLASYSSIHLATLNREAVAYAWMRDRLYCFDPATGRERFRFPWRSRKLESVNAMTPVVDAEGRVFLSDCYENGGVLLEPAAAADSAPVVVWSDKGKRKKSLMSHWSTPVLVNGYLYGCSGRHSSEAELRCVKLATGRVMWSKRGLGRTAVTAIDGHLVVLSERGAIRLVKANSKNFVEVTRWQSTKKDQRLDYPAWAAPIVSEGRMFVRGKKQLICFQIIPPNRKTNAFE